MDDRFNHEGYPDPTAYQGIKLAEKMNFRPVIYVCCAYASDPAGNTEKAKRYCRYAVDQGCIPICPILYLPLFMDDEKERELALFMDLVLLTKCAEVWVFGSRITDGMAAEISKAEKRNQKIRYFSGEEFACTK